MQDRLFYCRESEKIWSLEDLKHFYDEEADRDDDYFLGFETWLNNCLVQNNGTLEEVKPLYTFNGVTVWNIKTDLI